MILHKTLSALSMSELEYITSHLHTHRPDYRNMHLRESVKLKGKVVGMRLLHAIVARGDGFEGALSGPGVYGHYTVKPGGPRVAVQVLVDRVNEEADEDWLAKTLVKAILSRVSSEKGQKQNYPPNRKSGLLYLQRDQAGMLASHRHCQYAVREKLLSSAFVEKLEGWKLELLLAP